MRKWLSITPLILLAACARPDQQAGSAPVGSAPASTAQTASAPPPPAAPTAPAANPEPVEREPVELVANQQSVPVIPRGTQIRVRLDQSIDTKRNRAGDVVHATLMQPIVVHGQTVIPAGTPFTGHVNAADDSGRLKGRAYLSVRLDSFHLKGHSYRVATTSVERVSNSHKKRNGVLIGGGAGLGTILGAIAGGGKGALIGAGAGAAAGTAGAAATGKMNVSIPAETPLRFTLQSPVHM